MSDLVYDAFISYRRSDGGRTARWIRRQLEAFRPPPALRDQLPQRLRVYLDVAYERGTIDFFEHTIRPALLASRFLIIVATPDAVLRASGQQDWMAREIDEFSRGPNGDNLLVVRGAGPFDAALPGNILTRFPHIEVIDLRDVGRFWFLNPLRVSRISGEMLKLVAPIIDVPSRDMPVLRREQERIQQGRMGAATGAALAVFVTISTLTVYALVSRGRATTALESSLAVAGSIVLKLGGSRDPTAFSEASLKNLVNDVCDLFDGLRGKASTDGRTRPLLICYIRRANDHEALNEPDLARELLQKAIAEAVSIHARSRTADDGRSVVMALNELADFHGRRGDMKSLAKSLNESEPMISALQEDYPDQSFFPEARARRLRALAGLDEMRDRPSEQLSLLDKAAALADEAAQKQFEKKQAPMFALKGELLISAAEIASRVANVDAALVRLKSGVSALDAAIQADKARSSKAAIDAVAALAMATMLESNRGNTEAAAKAQADGRQRLKAIGVLQGISQSERARLQRIRAALDESRPEKIPGKAFDQ
ncbi:hypothetical protein C5688_10765 [Methylocystis sp. MitZ-2018]|nr:hypothetical protein C5688_10765 [Methylocystis sp. MitZ-2018]